MSLNKFMSVDTAWLFYYFLMESASLLVYKLMLKSKFAGFRLLFTYTCFWNISNTLIYSSWIAFPNISCTLWENKFWITVMSLRFLISLFHAKKYIGIKLICKPSFLFLLQTHDISSHSLREKHFNNNQENKNGKIKYNSFLSQR